MSVIEEAVDPFATAMVDDPYPVYARLLEGEPWLHEQSGYWIVSRYADVRTVLYDARFSRSDFRERAQATLGDGPLSSTFELFLLFRDPPAHTRLRRLISQAFTPLAVERMRQQIQASVDMLLDAVDVGHSFDLIQPVAYPLPVMVISALLGIPTSDGAQFRGWSAAVADALEAMTRPRPDALARSNSAVEEMSTYLRVLIADRRAHPRDDLLSDLIQARDGADRLTEAELFATSLLLFFAGHETTVNLIGNGMLALLRQPESLAALGAEPVFSGNAIEELLRFDSPVQRTFRATDEAMELGGQLIPAGGRVMALLGAANRDPRRFANPNSLDVRRPDAKHHLSLGGGIHYCIGAPLARLEAELTLLTLLRRLPGLRLADETIQWRPNLIFRGLQRLTVEIT